MASGDCHGWTATDPRGDVHENSASAIQCNSDGSFSFTQYAGNLTCDGTGVDKTFVLDECDQDIPPTLYTSATDLTCCTAPESPECLTDVPLVESAGSEIFLNGELCEP
ncbi:MAG: hypothetical protein VCC00_01055 [Deltaproteobacteria bacterium]